jgi:hypothetical protein
MFILALGAAILDEHASLAQLETDASLPTLNAAA